MKNDFLYLNECTNEEIEVAGIPFQVKKEGPKTIPYTLPVVFPCGKQCKTIFFLGMTVENGQGSGWWGQFEKEFDYTETLFIGDTIAKIHVVFEDGNEELVPVLFGVNAWNYELYEPLKPWEKELRCFFGPYREPFESDENAGNLLKNCLRLIENKGEMADKGSKWVMCYTPDEGKVVKEIRVENYLHKKGGVVISAVTAQTPEGAYSDQWQTLDKSFFLKRKWYKAADALSRRLYQYEDMLPEHVPAETPDGYVGPMASFGGSFSADMFTNIYRFNVQDMAMNKVDGDMIRTSSPETLNFGCYVGFGSYTHSSAYATQIWSRDAGRTLTEVVHVNSPSQWQGLIDMFHRHLYSPNDRLYHPHWKRIANVDPNTDNRRLWDSIQGAENDGHASIMLFIATLFCKGLIDKEFLAERKKELKDAAGWFRWQIENTEQSNFDKVLFSHSEASVQEEGGYDLFSNSMAIRALEGYAIIFDAIDCPKEAAQCREDAALIEKGCREVFGMEHPRYGEVYTDSTDDVWSWEYKRFAQLFLLPDITCYDAAVDAPVVYEEMQRTFLAQKEDYYSPYAGRQMGYGQGYLTETALMLDRYEEITECIECAAKFCYHHADPSYIVPEGVVVNGAKTKWFRNSDLGNGVQQGEIVKCARLILGLDDLNHEKGLKFVPRMPENWKEISVEKYPVSTEKGLNHVTYCYEKLADGYSLKLEAENELKAAWLRVGPFSEDTEEVSVTGDCAGVYTAKTVGTRKFIYITLDQTMKTLEIKAEKM